MGTARTAMGLEAILFQSLVQRFGGIRHVSEVGARKVIGGDVLPLRLSRAEGWPTMSFRLLVKLSECSATDIREREQRRATGGARERDVLVTRKLLLDFFHHWGFGEISRMLSCKVTFLVATADAFHGRRFAIDFRNRAHPRHPPLQILVLNFLQALEVAHRLLLVSSVEIFRLPSQLAPPLVEFEA